MSSSLHHVALLTVLALAPACAAENQTGNAHHSLSEVPQAARAALDRQAGGAELTGVEHETEHGVDVYEGAWTADGRTHEAKVTADGSLVEVEHAVPESEVPDAVRAEIARLFPSATEVHYVQKIFYVGGESLDYEIELRADGKRHEVLLSPSGQAVKDPTDEDEDEDVDGEDEDGD